MVRCNIERKESKVKKFKDVETGDFFVLAQSERFLYFKVDNGDVNNAIRFDADDTKFASIAHSVICITPEDVDIKVVL